MLPRNKFEIIRLLFILYCEKPTFNREMTELFNRQLLTKILASIPTKFEYLLQVRDNEPHTLNLLKLTIRAFMNNILRCHFLDLHGNDLLKALWLLQNIESSKRIFEQYNFLDYYPFIDENKNQYPSFSIYKIHSLDVNYNQTIMMERLPYILGAIRTLKNVQSLLKEELLERFDFLAQNESKIVNNFEKLSINLMFDIGEYNGTIMEFINIFLPTDTDDLKHNKHRLTTEKNEHRFNSKSICVLSQSRDGNRLLTFMPDSN